MFKGATDPADAEAWLSLVEKCFKIMGCPKERQVRLALFILQKETENWWKSIKILRGDIDTLDWKTFKYIFKEKYYRKT